MQSVATTTVLQVDEHWDPMLCCEEGEDSQSLTERSLGSVLSLLADRVVVFERIESAARVSSRSFRDTCPTDEVCRLTLGQSSRWARAKLSVDGAARVAVGGVLIIISSSSSEWTRSLTMPEVVFELVLEMTDIRWSLLLL